MPVYSFRCKSCDTVFDVKLRMGDKTKQPCVSCNSEETTRVLSAPSVILKGDGWTGKNIKIRGQMARKNSRLAVKEREFVKDSNEMKTMTVAPNVEGERVDSWSEARELARSKGKDTSTYDAYVRKEKR